MSVLAPHSVEAEASVVGQLLSEPGRVGEVVGTLLEPGEFYVPAYRILFDEIVTAYYADDPIDAISIAEGCAKPLAGALNLEVGAAVAQVRELVSTMGDGDVLAHAAIVKRDSDFRALLSLAKTIEAEVAAEITGPEELAATVSQTAMQIATSTLLQSDLMTFEEVGRRFVAQQRRLMAARAAGVELGAYFGLKFLDSWTRGLKPTEVFFLAGPPGSGKSAIAWKAAQQFAERQMRKPEEDRVGTLVLSLEMGEEPSAGRVAQTITGLDGGKIREGSTSDAELREVILEWGKRKEIPLYFNHASVLRANQMRALIVEAIRRHNVGFVVIDHFRYFDMDGRFQSKNEEDEEKVKFLAQRIAKDLNVALMVLAHTTKAVDQRDGGRPKLSDLRGSGQIAAEADFVAFVHRPYEHATEDEREAGSMKKTDAELLYEKSRHGLTGTAHFHFDPSTMDVR